MQGHMSLMAHNGTRVLCKVGWNLTKQTEAKVVLKWPCQIELDVAGCVLKRRIHGRATAEASMHMASTIYF